MTAIATTPTVDVGTVLAEEVALRIADIDPDPAQPRLEVDDELADSIKTNGVLKAIEVRPHPTADDRFMIVDGERRWRGARKAGLEYIPAKFATDPDVVGASDAARLKRQIVFNAGKPLTPVELALAFKKIIDDERANGNKKYGVVQLARDLGIAKSTATDRLAITEIADFWLPFIVKGPLQASHVPALHKIRLMPVKYQLRVLTRLQDQHSWPVTGGTRRGDYKRHVDDKGTDERIQVEEFDRMMDEALRPFIRPLSDVGAEYKGPTAKLKDGQGYYSKVRPMAIDPSQWEPILRKKRQAKAAKTRAAGGVEGKRQKEEDRYREQQRRATEQRQREERERKVWWRARPKIVAACVDAINARTLPQLQQFILVGPLYDMKRYSKSAAGQIAKGTTAEQFVRHMALIRVLSGLSNEWNLHREARTLGKQLGVDVVAIVKGDEEEQPDPKTTDPGPEGDGLLAVDGEEENNDE